ncbi:four helix bundle protein [Winogradskyella epiphytica]|uniref:Four helix bundle protein n=1 Tax=Winogradskyella epiphytica TaxID=262005 RepID=A0A2V4YEP9_9FLAO|nr:four helix bundle protein [Winogradskyella epiphytica]PYE81957.1 four helix bundle protein [Winogradskyella epiphytica]GGW61518.1 four helix bundle protein [Winogradskyella epiphytica]
MIKSYKDLEVHKLAFDLAMDIFWETRKFPKEEVYSLTSQLVRSSRSVSANISEGWAKRSYDSVFKQHLIHSLGSNSETEDWLNYAHSCGYLSTEKYKELTERNDRVGKMLTKLHQNWRNYEK